jgi:hypothetical protein
MGTVTYRANNGPPDYESQTIEKATFLGGNATGTINEFICCPSNGSYYTNAGIRVVLDDPIEKGVGDELIIEHRLTFYPQLSDATGVIDVSGVAYNYILRHIRVDAIIQRHFDNLMPPYRGNMWTSQNDIVDNLTDVNTSGDLYLSSSVDSYGGSLGSYYTNTELVWAINSEGGNRNVRSWRGSMRGIYSLSPPASGDRLGMQMQIGKVSDGTPLYKENTHELRMNWRTFPQRHIP